MPRSPAGNGKIPRKAGPLYAAGTTKASRRFSPAASRDSPWVGRQVDVVDRQPNLRGQGMKSAEGIGVEERLCQLKTPCATLPKAHVVSAAG